MKKYFLNGLLLALCLFFLQDVFAQETANKKLTLDLILNSGSLYPRSVRGIKPMNDGETYCQVKTDSINVYSYETGKLVSVIVTAKQLIPAGDTVPIPMNSFGFSDDESKILFATETESIYRRSSESNYFVYDRKTQSLVSLSGKGKQRLADFSPDASKVAFVRGNNLFIKDLVLDEEKQITFDGEKNKIINGTTDWVYEEEFAVVKGFHWSPDGNKIAFMRFDESAVKEWQLTYYGELYPEHYNYKYPKAGEDNSVVTVMVYDLVSGTTVKMNTGSETDQYIPRIRWTAQSGTLAIFRVNRLQNKFEILFAEASTGASRVIYSEENPYYIEDGNYDNVTFLKDGKNIILTSEKSGYNHIFMFNIPENSLFQITSGNWDVTELAGIDEAKKLIYYQSAEVSPLDRNVYVVDFKGKNKKTLISEKGSGNASFSSNFKYFIKNWSDASTPPVSSVNLSKDGSLVRILRDNKKLAAELKNYNITPREFFTITTSEGVVLNAWKILPPNFNPNKKYPVLFDIYGGPGSQTVRNSYGSGDLWSHYLAQEGIIVVSVDNRGTGARGQEFKKMTYQQLGKYETIDQIEAARYLASMPYIDKDHIAMFGWSFGGYMTASCLTLGADIFSVGIAVAPVTNWRHYDNIYTERFMRTPQENASGYDDNSPVNHASKLKGKLLIVHGMADDNVHPENTYDLVTALIAADKDFELMLYPNSNHGIYTGENTTMHLYKKMTKFLIDNLF